MPKIAEPPAKYHPNWLDELDGRYTAVQSLRRRYAAIMADIGGEESASYMEKSLVTRCLWLEHWMRIEEEKLAKGEEGFDPARWTQALNSLQGVFGKLGIKRRPRDVPDLQSYLKAKASQ